tara:strand:- start:359 stop:613 length:255 start_codon:yes stop_codon:yes gene_type:complete
VALWKDIVTPETDRGIASLKHPNKLKETSMANLVNVLVSMFGSYSARNTELDILTYCKTEYKDNWRHEYDRLVDQFRQKGTWKI